MLNYFTQIFYTFDLITYVNENKDVYQIIIDHDVRAVLKVQNRSAVNLTRRLLAGWTEMKT